MNAEASSNPVEGPPPPSGLICDCLNCDYNCDGHLFISSFSLFVLTVPITRVPLSDPLNANCRQDCNKQQVIERSQSIDRMKISALYLVSHMAS